MKVENKTGIIDLDPSEYEIRPLSRWENLQSKIKSLLKPPTYLQKLAEETRSLTTEIVFPSIKELGKFIIRRPKSHSEALIEASTGLCIGSVIGISIGQQIHNSNMVDNAVWVGVTGVVGVVANAAIVAYTRSPNFTKKN
ncbi:hypothetical protein HYU94_03905 [Candidatus Daviesbacteria bacterium]|nr:hypothetical protein [Candidatus Daviesbacteria bacterium]